MRILSFDTSTDKLQVALLQDGKIVCELSLEPETTNPPVTPVGDGTVAAAAEAALAMAHVPSSAAQTLEKPRLPKGRLTRSPKKSAPRQEFATSLLPMIDSALTDSDWQKDSLDAIVVGIGPGGFTAIRTGVVTARTLAQALGLPLIPVSLLEAYATASTSHPLAVVLAASKGSCFLAAYDLAVNDAGRTGSNPGGPSPDQSAVAEPGGTGVPIIKELVAPAYVLSQDIALQLKPCRRWAVHPSLLSELEHAGGELVALPKVKNIATQQAQIAWNRLSLTLSSESDLSASELRRRLLELFPYSAVQPLYLRNPSVTIKPSTK